MLVAFCVMTTGFNIRDYLTVFVTSWWMTKLCRLFMEGAKRQSKLLEIDGEHMRLMVVILSGRRYHVFADLRDSSTSIKLGARRCRPT
jgi:hypothetical protein